MNSGKIAGISPSKSKQINDSLFTYRQLIVDRVELST
jgi:hypothetical protein